ncbi:efflux RND transporter permease subunit [Solimicrobium silvestre]|uniref:MMPL family n=1 Tax=Solimicrobium silvestre TaxID=2099400 RepID=A0A2S9GTW5_9BURK|nr:MMPL family transporter [Solimicrobium silvestre]PRC91150.1 MMPL family [Solimicrobium silvestre]
MTINLTLLEVVNGENKTLTQTQAQIKPQPQLHPKLGLVERFIEPILFNFRLPVLIFFLLASILFAYEAAQLRPDASFQKMVPIFHPYIANYLKYENELRPLGNVVRIAVENKNGDIYSKEYLDTLKKITDEVFYVPGVDRGNLKSLWTPNVNWMEVTEAGMTGGQIIPQGFDGTPEKIEQVRTNIVRSGRIGSLVAADGHSTIVLVPLLETDPDTGAKLNYGQFSERLETLIRQKYETKDIKIHITGFAKVVGDLIHGAKAIGVFFAIAFVLTILLLLAYSRCWRSTSVTILCCSLAVIWQLGIVRMLGFGLDPYSILVPFLTFAIGVSHAVQNINTMAAARLTGSSNVDTAKLTFRQLFIPGSVALLCDAVGFSTLLVIKIGVIQELAISASIGVAVIILTKMFLLPILMSYVGVSDACLRHQAKKQGSQHRAAHFLSRFAEPRFAWVAVLGAALLLGVAWNISRDLKIGDLDAGAPELRPDSQYNRDNAYISAHYSTSPDVFVVMVKTPANECGSYPVAEVVDRFQWEMEQVAGVESTTSLFSGMKKVIAATNGGDLRWQALSRNRFVSNAAHRMLPSELYSNDCSMLPVLIFLTDHKADTLTRIAKAAENFAAANNDATVQFLLAAGNSGIEAATNKVIKQAEPQMLMLVYGIVALLVLWEFRSWRVTLCIMLPLYITSVLCEAIMAKLGLGVKVATLPVIALGIGIGVDYGIYIYNRIQHFLDQGLLLKAAYFETLKSTGAAVALTGVTLSLGVLTWVWSDIKFQADMGLLLTFMFLWNMVGAIVMIPALAALLVPQRPGLISLKRIT